MKSRVKKVTSKAYARPTQHVSNAMKICNLNALNYMLNEKRKIKVLLSILIMQLECYIQKCMYNIYNHHLN